MSLLDSDARVRRASRSLEDRAQLPLARFQRDVITEMRAIPIVRMGPRMEDRRAEMQQRRSRLIFIKMECVRELAALGDARKGLEDWLLTRYKPYLETAASNERLRRALVDRALVFIDVRTASIRRVVDMTEIALNDYDSRAFAFRDMVAALRVNDREM